MHWTVFCCSCYIFCMLEPRVIKAAPIYRSISLCHITFPAGVSVSRDCALLIPAITYAGDTLSLFAFTPSPSSLENAALAIISHKQSINWQMNCSACIGDVFVKCANTSWNWIHSLPLNCLPVFHLGSQIKQREKKESKKENINIYKMCTFLRQHSLFGNYGHIDGDNAYVYRCVSNTYTEYHLSKQIDKSHSSIDTHTHILSISLVDSHRLS